jgi:hypothetical protein
VPAGGPTIRATAIHTCFRRVIQDGRRNPTMWVGAILVVKQVTVEPRTGIAAICWDFERSGSSWATIGTSLFPALVYVRRDVSDVYRNFALTGSVTGAMKILRWREVASTVL